MRTSSCKRILHLDKWNPISDAAPKLKPDASTPPSPGSPKIIKIKPRYGNVRMHNAGSDDPRPQAPKSLLVGLDATRSPFFPAVCFRVLYVANKRFVLELVGVPCPRLGAYNNLLARKIWNRGRNFRETREDSLFWAGNFAIVVTASDRNRST